MNKLHFSFLGRFSMMGAAVATSGEPRGSPGWGTPGKIEFSAPRSPGKILKNPRGKSNNKLAKIDSFYQKNVIF